MVNWYILYTLHNATVYYDVFVTIFNQLFFLFILEEANVMSVDSESIKLSQSGIYFR